jgi:hypothetical protein
MKHLILFNFFALTLLSSFAQTNKEDIDLVQAIYGKEKKAIVYNFIVPTDDAKKTAFQGLYDAYETERKSLGQKRIALLEKYASVYGNMDDKATDDVMMQTMELQKKVDGIITTYYDKIKKSVGLKEAGQFYQLESYLLSATRIYILGNIPFIGELEKVQIPRRSASN